jgi:hypothetical protein
VFINGLSPLLQRLGRLPGTSVRLFGRDWFIPLAPRAAQLCGQPDAKWV